MPDLNRLADETSPYLLQHAGNPVDWYPWCPEAFERAKSQDKPVFLSIGYSACHWCHVMERESFENPEIARIMNDRFINIKVDREERPDIDQIYMAFVQLMTGRGGWPLSVFLTPNKEPYYGGTYFPPQRRNGMPSFADLLHVMSDFYKNNKPELRQNLERINSAFHSLDKPEESADIPEWDILARSAEHLSTYYEPRYGGIGNAPKFPAAMVFSLFMRHHHYSGDHRFLDMTLHTLQKMAQGGIYDQLAGGFARYSVDDEWLVPHFEKMLYDNALLTVLYLDGFLVTKDAFYLRIAEDIAQFIRTEMTSPEGGFYSSLDADSEGGEGLFYLWDKDEIEHILGIDAPLVCEYWGITPQGNFENKNILHIEYTREHLADKYGRSTIEIENLIKSARERLLSERNKRERPKRDEKILTAWNGLMLSAFARLFQVTRKDEYASIIINNTGFLSSRLYSDGILLHTFKDGWAKIPAFLDDYAFLIQGLLDAYEALHISAYLKWAIDLAQDVQNHFCDHKNGGYFYVSDRQEVLIHRLKDDKDNSTPSATGIMALNLLRIFHLTGQNEWRIAAEKILKNSGKQIFENPYGYVSYLFAVDFYRKKPIEIVVVEPDRKANTAIMKSIFDHYLPARIVVRSSRDEPMDTLVDSELLKNRPAINGQTTIYICHGSVCSLPVTNEKDLNKLLT